jgi:hypothetical protein
VAKVLERLSADLRRVSPERKGLFGRRRSAHSNSCLSAVDDVPRHPDDQPSIGIVLCRGRNEVVVEYSLRDMTKPLGVSEYQLTEALPDKLKGALPSVEELEAQLGEIDDG